MSDRIFLDTNILLYAMIDDGSKKHSICHKLLAATLVGSEIIVSTQVLNQQPRPSSGVCCSIKVLHSGFNTFLTAPRGGVSNPSARMNIM